MTQVQIANILQGNADRGLYKSCNDLASDCYKLGASYSVLAWLDRYCLTRGLYKL